MGLVSIILLSASLPVLTLMAATAWSPRGLDLQLDNIPWVATAPLVLTTIPAFGWGRRRFWAIAYYWTLGAILALAYPAVLAVASLIPTGLAPNRSPDGMIFAYYPFGCLLAISPLYWFLLRFLRLRYWRPWTDRSTWEPGDEVAPEWAKRVTGIMSPSARAHWKAEKARAEKKTVVRKPRVRRPPKRRR